MATGLFLCYTVTMNVIWPSRVAKHAEVWRVLDLSGLTNSPRESRNYVRAGFVFLNGEPIRSILDKMEIGRDYRLEIRFPNGVVQGMNIHLITPTYYRPRINKPDTTYRKA